MLRCITFTGAVNCREITVRLSVRLKKKLAAAVSVVALVGAAAGIAVGASEAAGAATGPTGGTWEAAQPFPGFSASTATLRAIACPALGDCVAVGYTSGTTTTPIVASESNGVWGSAHAIAGTGSLGNGSGGPLLNVSCGAPGDCTATGWYIGALGAATAFYVSEKAGVWGTAAAITSADQPAGTYSEVNGLSCAAAGYCTIVGRYTDQGVQSAGLTVSTPFTQEEDNGTWGTPQPVPGLASLPSAGAYANLDSVSCPAAGSCTATGEYGGNGFAGTPFAVSEAGSVWGNAEALQGTPSASGTSISCPDALECAVVMTHMTPSGTALYTVDEALGTWAQGQLLSMPPSSTVISGAGAPLIGCRSAGNCVIAGDMGSITSANVQVPFAATETSSGTWGAAAALPGIDSSTEIGTVQGLSCVPGGDCTIAGTDQATTGGGTDYIWTAVSSSGGSVGTVRQDYHSIGSNDVYGLSCPQDGYCTLAFDLDYKNMLGIETSPSAVAVTVSASLVTYGAEQSGKLTAAVSSSAGGTPTGTVTIKSGTTTACTLTLASGSGTCTLPSTRFPAGTIQLTATYSGSADYAASTSATKTLTVAKATSKTTLTLSATTITYGQEQAEHLTVTVSPQFKGTPAGKVTIKSGTATVCAITLASGTGRCTMTAKQLPIGGHTLIATYSGNGNFKSSASAKKTLTVVK